MLFFTYPCEIPAEEKQKLREFLEQQTGQKCLIADLGCTGVYYVPDHPDLLKETCGLEQAQRSPL